MITRTSIAGIATGIAVVTATVVTPVEAHHSFAMYDMSKTTVVTGVVDGIDPAPNHLSINFAIMNEERNNVIRGEDGLIVGSTRFKGTTTSPAVGPDGRIAFASSKDGYSMEIYIANGDGSNAKKLTSTRNAVNISPKELE